MRKVFIVLSLFSMILTIGLQSADAQFTISLPKIPKVKKPQAEPSQPREEVKNEKDDFTPDEIIANPNAPANYDANLAPGTLAVGIGNSGSPEKVKIVAKSGGIYKVKEQYSPNENVLYYKANSIYPYFDYDKLSGLVSEYRSALEPYVERYAAKHKLSEEKIRGDGFQFYIGQATAQDLKTRLDSELPKLAELEGKLKSEIGVFPETFTVFEYNPALVKEIAESRNEYYQAIIALKNSRAAEESVWLKAHRDGIKKAQKLVDEYDPATATTMGTYSEYALYAVSPKARTKWLTDASALEFKEPVDTMLAPLAAALAKKLPTYLPSLAAYKIRNPAEEALMKRVLTNPARYKVFYSGLEQAAWLIDKNALGIPRARYKRGLLYLRDTQADHPYCYATYVNVIQDYSGGGTYAASRAKLVQDDIVGCPAGK